MRVRMSEVRRQAATAALLVACLVGYAACSDQDRPIRATRSAAVQDISDRIGLSDFTGTTRTYGALVFDYDDDGWSDLLIGRHDFRAELMRNDRGRFVPASAIPFVEPWGTDRHSCAAGDVNGDGRADVYCVVGGERGERAKHTSNELWIQQTDGTFLDDGSRPDLADPYGRGREPALFDIDRDGDLDLLIGNASPRVDGRPSRNRVFMNEGAMGWRAAPELGLDIELSIGSPTSNTPQGALAVLDADGDGWLDVLLCAQDPSADHLRSYLFRNEGGRSFVDATEELDLEGEALDAAVVDLDGDGDTDVVTVDERSLTVRVQTAEGFERAWRMPIEEARRVAVADANGDGRVDIYIVRDAKPHAEIDDLLLVSGEERDYDAMLVPVASGNGNQEDDVVPIDHDRDGRSEFLVLNGLNGRGDRRQDQPAPLQVIAFEGSATSG
jgi:hypothetical protein